MRKSGIAVKIVAFLVIFSFVSGQVYAAPQTLSNNKLAASLATDPDINTDRSDPLSIEIAKKFEPDAIGDGVPVKELAGGRLPYRAGLSLGEYSKFELKMRDALDTLIRRSIDNRLTIREEYRDRAEKAHRNAYSLLSNFSIEAYPYIADVRNPKDYLLSFTYFDQVRYKHGFAVDFIDYLYSKYPPQTADLRLAQYIYYGCIPDTTLHAIDNPEKVYGEILSAVFGAGEVASFKKDLADFVALKLSKDKTVTTLKMPGSPDLVYGTADYDALIASIKANLDRPVSHDELRRIRNIIQSKAPPAFLSEKEKSDIPMVVDALTGLISLRDLGMKIKAPLYKGKPLNSIAVQLVDLKDEKLFRTESGNFYQEVVVYDEATSTLIIYMTTAFFKDNFSKDSTTAVTQTVLHPLFESIMGLSHQEAALALSFYNSDDTIAKPGTIAISDAHRALLEDIKNKAINGDKAAIRHLNDLLKPDFRFALSGADIQALKARGRSLESVDTIRVHSEELARIINGIVRSPVGKFDTKVSLKDVKKPDLIAGKLPTQDILNEYSLVANATIAAAIAVMTDGYVGKVTDLTEKAEVRIIKDGADGLAKREMQVIFNMSGYRIIVTVSEGGLRDEVEESFMGGESIGKGLQAISIALDVVENTNATAQGRAGGTSFAISAKGEGTLLGMAPDVYASLITAHVPPDKVAEFEQKPLDPGPYDGEENLDVARPKIKEQLVRIATANGIKLNNMEVVVLNRDRESIRLAVFGELEKSDGLKLTVIEDGTFNQAVKAAMGATTGRLKVFFGTSGAPEAFANVIAAKPFHKEGSLASMRVLSNAGLKKAKNMSPANAYAFNNAEQNLMTELRPEDAAEILAGKKLFTTADVKGDIDGSITFITDNEVFGLPGIKLAPAAGENTYIITTLRIGEKGGNAYSWVQNNIVSISPVGTKVGPYTVNKSASVAPKQTVAASRPIQVFAQYFSRQVGAHTGKVNLQHLEEIGVRSSLIGHSETRQFQGDTNKIINEKIKLAAKNGFKVILCVGEPKEVRESGKQYDYVMTQIEEALQGLSKEEISNTVIAIAYEPIWAINTGLTATPENAQLMSKDIRDRLKAVCSFEFGEKIRILYGGSVKAENAEQLFRQPDVDGFLIGGASLKAESFANICQIVNRLSPLNGRDPMVAANWKAEPAAKRDALDNFVTIVAATGLDHVDTIIALPYTLLDRAKDIIAIAKAPVERAEAQSVTELLNNIKDAVQVTRSSVIITDRKKFVDETVDYLAYEAALSQNTDVKAAAQRILREVALSFNLKLASINDFYMARQQGKWGDMTVPAVNGRTDLYHQFQQLFRAAKEKNVGALILELARSEMRYAAMDSNEFNAVGIASAIKQGYEGLIFSQGDHYQVNKEKYDKGGEEREKELKAIETLIRNAMLAGKYNIDLDPSTLVDESALKKILVFETEFVNKYLEAHPDFIDGLDENGVKSVRRRLVDEIETGEIQLLTPAEKTYIEGLYADMHKTTSQVTMRFIRYIRNMEKELSFPEGFHISVGIEERHIDNPEHKNNPSTVLGSTTLWNTISSMAESEGLVGPSKISLQTGTMHGVGGEVDFGIYKRHLKFKDLVYVQHGASTLEKQDFDKMREGNVGEVHLATEYQKMEFDIVSRMMPELGEEMAKHLVGMMGKDAKMDKKFRPMWELAFGRSEVAIASIKPDDTKSEEKIALYTKLSEIQSGKSRATIINEILGDTMPKGLKGTLKDLVKELPGPFKRQLMNLPPEVRAAVDKALYEEFSTILEKLGASNTKAIVEKIVPFKDQPVMMPARPAALQNEVKTTNVAPGDIIADLKQAIADDLPIRAQMLKANLVKILSEHPDELFFAGIEDEIGEGQKAQMMPLYKAVDEIQNMKDAKGNVLFPNLVTKRGSARNIIAWVMGLHKEKGLKYSNTFIGASKSSVDNNAYVHISGEGRAWIAAIDDSVAGDYLPVFEAIILNMMAYLNADLIAIKNFYDAISDKPIDPGVLQDMLKKRIIYILPRATAFDTRQLRELYELAAQVYVAA